MAELNAPPARASIAQMVLDRWPWLARVGIAASGALGIRSAAGRTELEGGGPAVARVGDVAGELAVDVNHALWVKAGGVYVAVPAYGSPGPPPPAFIGATFTIQTGSSKVTCG